MIGLPEQVEGVRSGGKVAVLKRGACTRISKRWIEKCGRSEGLIRGASCGCLPSLPKFLGWSDNKGDDTCWNEVDGSLCCGLGFVVLLFFLGLGGGVVGGGGATG